MLSPAGGGQRGWNLKPISQKCCKLLKKQFLFIMKSKQHDEKGQEKPPNGYDFDPHKMENVDEKELEKARMKEQRKKLVNLGMIKVSPGLADQLKTSYEDYERELDSEVLKLFKAEYYGRLMEEAMEQIARNATPAPEAQPIGQDNPSMGEMYDKSLRHLEKAEEHLQKAEKKINRSWMIVLGGALILAFLLFIYYRIARNKSNEEA